MPLPVLTADQRADALARATEARRRRAETKIRLKNREVLLSEVLDAAETDDALAKMRVTDLLESLPRVGPHRAELLIDEFGISRSRRLKGLGPLQRQVLVERFG